MVLSIPGSGILTSTLNVISQSLLIPVIILLLIFVVYAVITIGSLISEYSSRKKVPVSVMKNLIHDISLAENAEIAKSAISSSEIPEKQKEDLLDLISSEDLSKESREALARKLIENEENLIDKILEKTDIMARIGPTLGLMGTLIPMGPGLAALGSGDVTGLANAIIVAFDTTVVGIGAGAVGYLVSKIRKRWYDDYLSNLDALSDAVLDFMKKNYQN
ncbi:MAG: MotA/TolQ/ExbB proton channel family protein [Methanobrevibacter arboriphilus]|jgi:biopolymer transport protein ExbB/TolQ|uniref:Flagellar motor protein MotA n=2 Tax=Methanobrevibacter arboriphilus TaxID=39441 RepID=A0ACA8R0U8_METAZ|nr:MotA/TolQ/ExbB proton channel family protein [Methanobrevibacter arboriphilus]MBF4468977.1 MotA/TolQ/ExbB proton channel family protein [Methanobrevibacter arboriphilus]MCC7562641.1 MotA/TolQ/ExbB proton channel family protein [Methanobrevibacter arboriphilus]BBL61055.1 flagellar motor protein MotA [Methanobrevibacter arboriphilus]GLI12619.1 flagellar motor protein MotA [Methanobrevibacter arboriphilus]